MEHPEGWGEGEGVAGELCMAGGGGPLRPRLQPRHGAGNFLGYLMENFEGV